MIRLKKRFLTRSWLFIPISLATVANFSLIALLQSITRDSSILRLSVIKDNTPELLQYSSLSLSTQGKDLLPLPPIRVLPPPTNANPQKTLHGRQSIKLSSPIQAKLSERKKANKLNAKAFLSSGKESIKSAINANKNAMSSSFYPINEDNLNDASTILRLLRKQKIDPSFQTQQFSLDPNGTNSTGKKAIRIKLIEESQQNPYLDLWNISRPIALPRSLLEMTKKEQFDIRLVSLSDLRAQEIEILHGQILVKIGRAHV